MWKIQWTVAEPKASTLLEERIALLLGQLLHDRIGGILAGTLDGRIEAGDGFVVSTQRSQAFGRGRTCRARCLADPAVASKSPR